MHNRLFQKGGFMKLQKKLALYLCTSLVIMTVLLLRTDRKVAASSSSCGSWSVVSSPNVKGNNSEFHAVAASSANNVWAVGDFYNTDAGTQSTLTEHWNGSKWSIVSSANIGSFTNVLHAVAVVSSSNVWAVGYTISSTTFYTQALIEHWNGSKWSTVSSPIIGTDFNELYAISAVSSNNVWAVGDYRDNNAPYAQTLIEHWNDSKWNVVSSLNVAGIFYGVAA